MENGEAKKIGRDLLDAGNRRKMLDLDVPGYGTVSLREMGAEERDMLEERAIEWRRRGFGSRGSRALLIMLSMVGPEGERIFADADLPELNKLPGEIADRIATAAAELSGIGAKALEAAKKNSETIPSDSPSSDSPAISATQP